MYRSVVPTSVVPLYQVRLPRPDALGSVRASPWDSETIELCLPRITAIRFAKEERRRAGTPLRADVGREGSPALMML